VQEEDLGGWIHCLDLTLRGENSGRAWGRKLNLINSIYSTTWWKEQSSGAGYFDFSALRGSGRLKLLTAGEQRTRKSHGFSSGKKLWEMNPVGISGMKQDLRYWKVIDVNRVIKPYMRCWCARRCMSIWKPFDIKCCEGKNPARGFSRRRYGCTLGVNIGIADFGKLYKRGKA